MTIDEALERLNRSKFRSSFHLSQKDKKYYREKGEEVIREHCVSFVKDRLGDPYPINDGKQTPMRGHPVFVAQHACACCCRGCLKKWYKVNEGVALSEVQQEKIVNLLMAWIKKELNNDNE